ncbi:MAG: STIV orfB116 family protein [Leptospirillia bacterium]
MALYLLNSPVLTDFGLWSYCGPLTVEEARVLVEEGFRSAIGHASTAVLLSRILGTAVSVDRTPVTLLPGDRALVFHVERRVAEGRILTEAELLRLGYRLGVLERLP